MKIKGGVVGIFKNNYDSEKASKRKNVITSVVDLRANKRMLKGMFSNLFGFKPVKVNTHIYKNQKIAFFTLRTEDMQSIRSSSMKSQDTTQEEKDFSSAVESEIEKSKNDEISKYGLDTGGKI